MSIILPELFPEKKKVLNLVLDHLSEDIIGYIDVPTGYGKTFLSKHLINRYVEKGKRILFITSRNKYLLLQTYFKEIDEKIPLFPNSICLSSDFEMSKWEDDKIKDYILNNNILVVFASLQTILSKKKVGLRYFFSVYFDLVIIDEIHNFIKNQGNEFINQIITNDPNCHIFGMSATPFQGVVNDLKYVEEIAQGMKEIFHKTIPACILDQQLSPLTYTIIRNHMDFDLIFNLGKNFEGLNAKELYLDWSQLEKIVERTKLAKQVCDEKVPPKSKTLIFCAPVKNVAKKDKRTKKKIASFHAKLCAAIFNGEVKKKYDPDVSLKNKDENNEFKRAAYISSDLKNKEIEEIISAFKTPNTPPYVLCTVGMLVEGFNFPRLENLFLLRPTLSMRLFEQEIGRVLRKHEGKIAGNIFEVVEDVDVDSLYEKFGESLLSSKKFKRLMMLNPKHRLERLFLQEAEDIKAFEEDLIEIKDEDKDIRETDVIDVEKIGFKDFDKSIHDLVTRFPPVDFRVKFFVKAIQKTNLKKNTNFKKDKNLFLELVSKFNPIFKDDIKDMLEAIPIVESMNDDNYDDRDLSQKVLEDKTEFFKEVNAFIKLKALTDIEKLINLSKDEKEEIFELLGFGKEKGNIKRMKELCLVEGKGVAQVKFFSKQLPISIGVLTGKLEKVLADDIKSGAISKRNRIFNKKDAKSDVYWAETYYHNNLDYLYKIYDDYYGQEEIKIGL